jgi:dimethylhistidine N-methyltransferase
MSTVIRPARAHHAIHAIHDAPLSPADVRRAALSGLCSLSPTLPCSLFYDEAGAALFEQICTLPEYYPTRTEISILRHNIAAIGDMIGGSSRLIELGSGDAVKSRLLLRHINAAEYIPIDISRAQLLDTATRIGHEFPGTRVSPICADYTRPLQLPAATADISRSVVFFPGSTIGNFEPDVAQRFLHALACVAGTGGGLLIGADLHKSTARLEAAYNDQAGITARFNLNLLTRLNREAGADFDPGAFRHRAIYNERYRRIEMHLISQRDQRVTFAAIGAARPAVVELRRGTIIVTEHSYKYTHDVFKELVRRAGWLPIRSWTDADQLFSVHWCVAA